MSRASPTFGGKVGIKSSMGWGRSGESRHFWPRGCAITDSILPTSTIFNINLTWTTLALHFSIKYIPGIGDAKRGVQCMVPLLSTWIKSFRSATAIVKPVRFCQSAVQERQEKQERRKSGQKSLRAQAQLKSWPMQLDASQVGHDGHDRKWTPHQVIIHTLASFHEWHNHADFSVAIDVHLADLSGSPGSPGFPSMSGVRGHSARGHFDALLRQVIKDDKNELKSRRSIKARLHMTKHLPMTIRRRRVYHFITIFCDTPFFVTF